jgi:hypothetical protein
MYYVLWIPDGLSGGVRHRHGLLAQSREREIELAKRGVRTIAIAAPVYRAPWRGRGAEDPSARSFDVASTGSLQ